jgi:hypothetical protein
MSRRLPTALLGGLLTLLATPPAHAQGTLPSGREVVNRFIQAVGGRDVVLAQSGRHTTGTFDIPAQGMSGALDVYAQPPNKMVARVTIQGIGEITTGYDGTTAWAVNPMMGPMVLDSLQAHQTRQQADFYSNLYPEDQIPSLETVADTTFEGTPSYQVKVTTAWGETYDEFFDKETGLILGSHRNTASPMGNVDIVTVVSDWRTVEGMLVAFKSVQRTMGIEQVVTITQVDVTTVPDSMFVPPPEIQALIKK